MTSFFELPLAEARICASRLMHPIDEPAALSEDRGAQRSLEDALVRESLGVSTLNAREVSNEIIATARMVATVEWRDAGYKPRDTPTISASSLEAALIMHLNGSPRSVPAVALHVLQREHETLYRHSAFRPPNPSMEAFKHASEVRQRQQQLVYDYWQNLRLEP